ncbi:unnamed protein product [Phaedon cochleariae]|uniref:C3H1-type domain-containing protein n=1 Tax=Phaedon cochleariae TaxID=80249 RepID=A0A9N9SDK0_PHACE|nr:unnamed protein product [Phaedon cochleariae]
MIVEQVDSFRTWLTAVLKPMCEADPAALAKYVLALIKKDKSEEELRKSMIGQLDVFLEGETEGFVDLVFQTLTTKDYIDEPVIPNTNPPNPNIGKPAKDAVKESKVIVQPSELPNLNEAVNGGMKKELEVKRDKDARRSSDAEREERLLRRRSPLPRHRSLSRNRTRSRSRSWDRVKRSRSREKSKERLDRERLDRERLDRERLDRERLDRERLDRERLDRERLDREQHRVERDKRERLERPDRPKVWRNKSPPRRYERRRPSRSPSPLRVRSRSRSPRHSHRGRFRIRSSASRSRSRSLEKRDRRDSAKEKDKDGNNSRPNTPSQDFSHGSEVDARLSIGQNVQNLPPGGKKRCRDFDEKGYCMRGEMCPFDHGIDPVVLEDSALTRVLTYHPNGAPGAGGGAGPPPQPDHPYNPQAPQIWRDGRFRGARPMGIARVPPMGPFPPPPPHNRELIPVPVMDSHKPPPDMYTPMYQQHRPGYMDHDGGYRKKQFDFNRLGPRAKNPQNCSLELKKVPTGLNSITHLNNHFSRFGKIVNIQVQFEGDPEAAMVTFSSHAEANAAYRSTEAVLNNRFIKVFWHNALEGKQENVPPQCRPLKDRLGGGQPSVVAPNTNKVLNLVQPRADSADPAAPGGGAESGQQEEEKPASREESKAQATEAIKKNQELLATQAKVKRSQDVQRKEVLKMQKDLRRKKQELLDKQLTQQRVLIEKMEKLPAGPQRDLIKETIKKTQEAIEAIKKDLEAAALASKASPLPKKSKEEAQRELLDTELDLIAKQQEGADTSEIQKRLLELRARVANVRGGSRGARGGRRYTPVVSRHLLSKNNLKPKSIVNAHQLTRTPSATSLNTAFQKHTVDHRPTRLLVSGYETDEQDSVIGHFQQFGEIADYEVDSTIPSITFNYKSRKEAEMALLKGKNFQDRTLSITWSINKQLSRQRSSGSTTRTVVLSETEEDQLIDSSLLEGGDDELGPEISEEALLQDDEEEDEEDRSWRR